MVQENKCRPSFSPLCLKIKTCTQNTHPQNSLPACCLRGINELLAALEHAGMVEGNKTTTPPFYH